MTIPKLPKDELLVRAGRIKPVFSDMAGQKHFMQPVDLETEAFTWQPEPAFLMGEGFTEVAVIHTNHSGASPWFFKPDIHEVLVQIPAELLGRVTAFETVFAGDTGQGVHVGKTTLYQGVLPAEVLALPVIYKGEQICPPLPVQAAPLQKAIATQKPTKLIRKIKPPHKG